MQTISYSEARKSLARTMSEVCDNHQPTIITRRQHESVVMLSLDDYNALNETAYLLRSPKNASRIFAALEQLNTGKGIERSLVDVDDSLENS